MIRKITRWLDGLDLKDKVVYSILALLLLVISPEFIVPSIEWKIQLTPLRYWFTNNYWFLLRLFLCSAALLLLYVFFWQGKLGLFFGRLLQHRVLLVLFVGVVEGILVYYYWHDAIDYFRAQNDEGAVIGSIPVWMGTFISTLIAAPIALFIWSFRNEDKRLDLQHIEENIRQTEFLKIEKWATTFPKITSQESKSADLTESEANTENTNPDKLKSSETKEDALQIVAIYQLLPYLKGEYGDRFVRPTMEIYRSLLSSWQWSDDNKEKVKKSSEFKIKIPDYIAALHIIFQQEDNFFRIFHRQPICENNNWAPLIKIDLKKANLRGTNFIKAKLNGATLYGADFSGADLISANLCGADLRGADLRGTLAYNADLSRTNLIGADFSSANLIRAEFNQAILSTADFSGADLIYAELKWANLSGADFSGANLYKATYDEEEIKKATMDERTILKDGSRWKPPEDD